MEILYEELVPIYELALYAEVLCGAPVPLALLYSIFLVSRESGVTDVLIDVVSF